jgi:hypothetical protein
MLADDLEQLADEPVGCPVGDTDAPTLSNNACEFGRCLLLVWGEHDTEGRQRDVERAICIRQRLGISLLESNGQALGIGALLASLQKRVDVVGRGYLAKAARGGKCGIAVSRSNIDYPLICAQVDGFA